mmetsp:Transcript_34952/g.56435  ORF Transcript_34952/g.56435 Transcript_34952/m.56435 type:complete len:241 (-) Transcript_34952:724-1446(-)
MTEKTTFSAMIFRATTTSAMMIQLLRMACRISPEKNPSQGAAPGFQVGFGGVGSRRSLPPFVEADMTEGLKERVYYVMLDAFDNYPPQEVSKKLDMLWEAGPNAGPTRTSLRQLVQLTAEVESIAADSRARSQIPGAQFEDLLDALQVARSRVRMNGNDADMYDPKSLMGFFKTLESDSESPSAADPWAAWGFGGKEAKDKKESRRVPPPLFGQPPDVEGKGGEGEDKSGSEKGGWWPFK